MKHFQIENKQGAIRVYRLGVDEIFVEDKIKGKYVDLSSYLKTIPDEYNRAIKKEEIERLVWW